MRKARTRSSSDIFHVVARGVGQQIIFESDADKRRYLEKLFELLGESHGTPLAWCLMDNHVHLLIQLPIEALSTLMRRQNSGYARYFNLVHGRSGHLFQGRFASEPVEKDEYLMTVVRYIHQNPLKAGISTNCSYPWSSYDSYLKGEMPKEAQLVVNIFGGMDAFVAFHAKSLGDVRCLEVEQAQIRFDDARALEIALGIFGDEGLGAVKSLPRCERDAALSLLKEKGLSVRQIQRLTGVSVAMVSRAGRRE